MDNANAPKLEDANAGTVSEDHVDPRAALIEDFLTHAKNLDRDQNQVIDERDVGWYSRWGEYTPDRERTYNRLMRHQHTIDPESEVDNQVSVHAIDALHANVRARLNRADESKPATDEATKRFDDIDTDRNGFLTEDEAHQAYRFGKISQETSQFLEKNDESFQSLSNDEWGFENNGITRKDLSIASQRETSKDTLFLDALADELKGAPDLLFDLKKNWFDYLDLNDDEIVTRQELKYHTNDAGTLLSKDHQELVKLLYEHDDLFTFVHPENDDNPPLLTEGNITRLAQTVEGLNDDHENQFNNYRRSQQYNDSMGNYAFGYGLPAGLVGAAVGAGACGVAAGGNPFAADIGGVLGGGAGFFAGAAVGMHVGEGRLEAHFNREYEQKRQPALESFIEKYRFLRNDYLSTNGPAR